jgi:hypothetical protein
MASGERTSFFTLPGLTTLSYYSVIKRPTAAPQTAVFIHDRNTPSKASTSPAKGKKVKPTCPVHLSPMCRIGHQQLVILASCWSSQRGHPCHATNHPRAPPSETAAPKRHRIVLGLIAMAWRAFIEHAKLQIRVRVRRESRSLRRRPSIPRRHIPTTHDESEPEPRVL